MNVPKMMGFDDIALIALSKNAIYNSVRFFWDLQVLHRGFAPVAFSAKCD